MKKADSKEAARIRYRKKQGKASAKELAKLAKYEAAKEKGNARGMDAALASDPEPANDEATPIDPRIGDQVPLDAPAEATPDPAKPPIVEAIEPPPPVEKAKPRADANASAGKWQDKYQLKGGGNLDGREMLCVFIADNAVSVLAAAAEDLALIGKKPVIDPAMLRNVWILGLDQLLPDRARLTPQVGMLVGSAAIGVQRIANHKAITEAQKSDPNVQKYKREQAEEAAKSKAQREAEAAADEAKAKEMDAKIKADRAAAEAAKPRAAAPPAPPPKIDHMPAAVNTNGSTSPSVAIHNSPAAPDGKLFT